MKNLISKIIFLCIIFYLNTTLFASNFSDNPKYIPKKDQKTHILRKVDKRGLIVKKYHHAGRNTQNSLGLSRGLSAHKFHKSGRRRGMAIGLSRGLNVRQYHKSGRRKGISLGLSRGLNVSQFHKSGRHENSSVIGLSRGLSVHDFHKAGRKNMNSVGLSRGQAENESESAPMETSLFSNSNSNNSLNTYLFKNIRNEKPITHYLAASDEDCYVNFQHKQTDETSNKSQNIPFVTPLSPDHVGFTSTNTPEIFWYISSPWNGLLEFTINEVGTLNPEPVLYAIINGVEKEGIYSFNLNSLSVSLKENLEYEFFIAIVMDEIEKSANIVVSSVIKYIKADQSFVMKMKKVPLAKDYYLYAENGYFYDAIDHLSEVIIQSGFDDYFKCHRASLLRQVGLDKTAQFDCTK